MVLLREQARLQWHLAKDAERTGQLHDQENVVEVVADRIRQFDDHERAVHRRQEAKHPVESDLKARGGLRQRPTAGELQVHPQKRYNSL